MASPGEPPGNNPGQSDGKAAVSGPVDPTANAGSGPVTNPASARERTSDARQALRDMAAAVREKGSGSMKNNKVLPEERGSKSFALTSREYSCLLLH